MEEKSKIVEKLLADGESLMRACRDWEAIAKREIGRREVEQAKLEAERARVLRLLDELAAMHGPLAFIGKVQLRDAIASGREEL